MNFKLLTLLGLTCLVGCEQMDNLEDMHSSTMDMSETTSDMSKTTQDMKRGTLAMYHQLRSKEGQETRARSLRNLLESETFEEKLTHTVPYYQGFEFQLWTGDRSDVDVEHFRDELLAVGVDEFFRAIQSIMSEVDAREESPSTKNNEALSAFALAVTLHETHVSQDTLMSKKYEKFDFLSMIKEALEVEPLVESGEMSLANVSNWQRNIMFKPWKETAIDLLYMRHQMLVGMALVQISDVERGGFIGDILTYLRRFKSWDSQFLNRNLVTQEEVNKYLEESISTRNFLQSLGYEVELSSLIKGILDEMDFQSCGDICSEDRAKNHEEFKKYIQDLLD